MLHLITNQEILLFAFCSIYVLITKEISIFFVTFDRNSKSFCHRINCTIIINCKIFRVAIKI